MTKTVEEIKQFIGSKINFWELEKKLYPTSSHTDLAREKIKLLFEILNFIEEAPKEK